MGCSVSKIMKRKILRFIESNPECSYKDLKVKFKKIKPMSLVMILRYAQKSEKLSPEVSSDKNASKAIRINKKYKPKSQMMILIKSLPKDKMTKQSLYCIRQFAEALASVTSKIVISETSYPAEEIQMHLAQL